MTTKTEGEIPGWALPVLLATVIAAVAVGMMWGVEQYGPPGSASSTTTQVEHRWSRLELENWAYSKTKAEIRETFGSPVAVAYNGPYERWIYNDSVPVYDEDAGTRLRPTFVFLAQTGTVGQVDF